MSPYFQTTITLFSTSQETTTHQSSANLFAKQKYHVSARLVNDWFWYY